MPSSKNGWAAEPPIKLRSPVTASPVLGGVAAGLTTTVSSELVPRATTLGAAEAVPVGESHTLRSEPVLRGAGAATLKSVLFWSVSMLSVAVGAPSAQLVPVP